MAKLLGGTTVYGLLSATGTIYASGGNSINWNNAVNITSLYQNNSSSFATNTLLQSTSSLLTPLTLTDNLTSQLVTKISFNDYQTNVAASTAILLPTSIYQDASGSFATNTALYAASSVLLPTSIYQDASGSFALKTDITVSAVQGTTNQISTSNIGGTVTISLPNYIDVNTIKVNTLSAGNGNSEQWNSSYTIISQQSANNNSVYNNVLALSTFYSSVTAINGTIYQIEAINNDGNVVLSIPNSFRTPGDLNVGGNLYVAGSAITLNTSTLSVSSPIIYINNSLSGDGNVFDIGLVGHFNNGLYQHTGLVRSAKNNYWSLFSGLTSEPLLSPTLNYDDPTFTIDTLRANILGSLSGNVIGNISGNANTVTNGVYTTELYSDPSWINSLADTKITGTKFLQSSIYQDTSGSFATNTALDAASSILLPTSVYLETSGSFATNTALDAASSILLPTSVYLETSGSFATNTALDAASSILLPTSVYLNTSGSFVTYIAGDSRYQKLSAAAVLPSLNYLPLSGGTLTGPVTSIGSVTFHNGFTGAFSVGADLNNTSRTPGAIKLAAFTSIDQALNRPVEFLSYRSDSFNNTVLNLGGRSGGTQGSVSQINLVTGATNTAGTQRAIVDGGGMRLLTGGLTANGAVFATGGNSNQWNSAYSIATTYQNTSGSALSAISSGPYTLVNSTTSIRPVFGDNLSYGKYSVVTGGGSNNISIPALTNNIFAYWNFNDNGSGGVSLIDSTGNSKTLTPVGSNPSSTTGIINRCASFTPNQGLSLTSVSTMTEYSVSLWFNTSNVTNQQTLFAGNYLNLYLFGGQMYLNNFQSTNPEINGVGSFTTNTWYHLAIVSSGGTTSLYSNGTLLGSTSQSIYIQTVIQIGYGNNSWYYNGRIDEVGVWDRALTLSEITDLYNSGYGKTYPFNSNIASSDYSFIAAGYNNNTNNKENTFILGSNITAPLVDYTYVNNLSSQGLVSTINGNSNQWNSAYNITSTYQNSASGTFVTYTAGDSRYQKLSAVPVLQYLPLSGGNVTGNVSINKTTAEARLHVAQSNASGFIGALPSNTTQILESNNDNFLTFRNRNDTGTYAGIVMQDNNIGGYVLYGHFGAGDKMYIGGYTGVDVVIGTSNTTNPALRTTIANFTSTGVTITGNLNVSGTITSNPINTQTGTTYTVQTSDNNAVIVSTNSSGMTLTISGTSYSTGFQITVIQAGAGQVTFAASGGATINQAFGYNKTSRQYATATLVNIGSNNWVLFGDVSN